MSWSVHWRLSPGRRLSTAERAVLAETRETLGASVDDDGAHGTVAMPWDRRDEQWPRVLDALRQLRGVVPNAMPDAMLAVNDSLGLVGWNANAGRDDLQLASQRDQPFADAAMKPHWPNDQLARIVGDPDAEGRPLMSAIRLLALKDRSRATNALLVWRARHDRDRDITWRAELLSWLADLRNRAAFDTLILELAAGHETPVVLIGYMLSVDYGRALPFVRRALPLPGVAAKCAVRSGPVAALLEEFGRSPAQLAARSPLELLSHSHEEVRAAAAQELSRIAAPEHLLAMAISDSLSEAIRRRTGHGYGGGTSLAGDILARRHQLPSPQQLTPELEEILTRGAEAVVDRYIATPVLVTEEERAHADRAEQDLITASGR